jgi:hypothetical protein
MDARLEVQHRRIPVPQLNGLYSEHPSPAGLAIDEEASNECQESLELEAESLMQTGRAHRWGGREFLYEAESYETMSRRRITNLKKTIEYQRPEWVEALREAARASDNMYVVIGLAGLSDYPYPAVAILEILHEQEDQDAFS